MRLVWRFVAIVLTLAALVLAGRIGFLLLTDPDLASIEFDTFHWVANDKGFTAEETAARDQTICVCPGYECEANIEPTHLAFQGWLRRYFVIVKDPLAGDRPDWGRSVEAKAACVTKKNGDSVRYILTEFKVDDSVGEKKKPHLLLTLE